MQYLRFIDDADRIRFGCNPADDFADAELLGDSPLAGGKPTGCRIPVKKLLCPIEPTAILCIGLNYRKHAEETGAELPQWPVLFMKNLAAANHPGDPIALPKCSVGPEVDYECELGVVIGKAARDVKPADVFDHVLGYTVGNDVSARRWQKHSGGGQWVRGKSFDTFCPFGPVIVDTEQIPDPQTLNIATTLNGQTMQQSNTADMIFSVVDLVSELSKDLTLLPGTLLLTGTPSGVGVARKPPVYLKAGDSVTCTISGIGSLTNPVVEE